MGGLHIFCIVLSAFVCLIYVSMMKVIKEDKPVQGHVLVLSVYIFCFAAIVLRNMY